MAIIRPFRGLRPPEELAEAVAARPYDVLNSAEARAEAEGNEMSFLRITKPEIDLPEDTDPYSQAVYDKARENLNLFIKKGWLVPDREAAFYVYRQIMGAHAQVGLVACSSNEDYFNDVIKKHEFTRPVKENDRINHMKTLGAHPGPVFLTYPGVHEIDTVIEGVLADQDPDADFAAEDGVRHTLWVVNERPIVRELTSLFKRMVPATYIADGHHRAASSAKVGKAMQEANPAHTGEEEYNFFLSVLFPADQLRIIDYNRVIKDLNGHSEEALLEALAADFDVSPALEAYAPEDNYCYGLYLPGRWYRLELKPGLANESHPIESLDIHVLSERVIDPVFGIADQRTDDRIDFVGGIRGLGELERRVDSGEMACAFSIHPVSIGQLMEVADSGEVMPPKTTWFEPKLRSGLVVHRF
jgi:uncharacterized protein (DUF1015 family)